MAKTVREGSGVASSENDYSAPALEKGLDILELMAEQSAGLSQSQIAAALNRSIQEIYRMLASLERRGYLHRSPSDDLYYVSLKLFEVAHRQPPMQGLLQLALPYMRRLADETMQSCNLGIHSAGRVLVVAQVESPALFGISVRPGALFPMLPNAPGRVLLAHQEPKMQESMLKAAGADNLSVRERDVLSKELREIVRQGYADVRDREALGSITISCPIVGAYGNAVAALTVPYMSAVSFRTQPVDKVRSRLRRTATAVSTSLAGVARNDPT